MPDTKQHIIRQMRKLGNVKKEKSVNNGETPEKVEVMELGDKAFKTIILNAVKDIKEKYINIMRE